MVAQPSSTTEDQQLLARAGVALPPGTKVTPMLRQWLEAKAKAKDAILLFRMGDFYELFGDDAKQAGEVLDLAVTTRDRDKGENAMPMAGFPHPQAPVYIARLIAAGLKVAVCDQMEDPALAKGIVKRGLSRVVTPGQVVDDESLDARANNFLAGVARAPSPSSSSSSSSSSGRDQGRRLALCALDVSTGEFLATVVDNEAQAKDELLRLQPREIVVAADVDAALFSGCASRVEAGPAPHKKTPLVDALGAADRLLSTAEMKPALIACELVLGYVKETGQGALPSHLLPPLGYVAGAQLLLDATTRGHLDLCGPPGELRRAGTLLSIIDESRTAAGGRRLLRMLQAPSASLAEIGARLDRVQAFVDDPGGRAALRELLTSFPDVERLVARAAAGRSTPRDLVRLRAALVVLPQIRRALVQEQLAALAGGIDPLAELCAELERALVDDAPLAVGQGPLFQDSYDKLLDDIVKAQVGGRDRIAELEEAEKKATGIGSLKVRYTSVFGYYIEVTRTHLQKVPERYKRKQTVANGERYVTDELQKLEDVLEGASGKRLAREQELFAALVSRVVASSRRLLDTAAVVADIDAAASLAEVAARERWVRPVLVDKDERRLSIAEARHPMVERLAKRRGEPFVPSNVSLSDQRQILVVTGPNMAGKSTMMRQVALIQVLAQLGSFVPAKEATLSLCDRIFTRVGASDDLSSGRSTFMVEMTETSHILRAATPCSLVLLDEIGRGTSTWDGLSIAWAVAEHLHDVTGCRTLFATHYHELTALQAQLPRLKNVHVVVKEWNDEIIFVRNLEEGAAERSYGIQVARLAGLPQPVIERAREVLASLEGKGQKAVPVVPHKHPLGRNEAPPSPQLSLLPQEAAPVAPPASHPLVDKLRSLDVLQMTPLQALVALAALVDDAKRG